MEYSIGTKKHNILGIVETMKWVMLYSFKLCQHCYRV